MPDNTLLTKPRVTVKNWIALIFLVVILSGIFQRSTGPLQVLDFTNLSGKFGVIGDTGANFIGKGGSGAKDGFMAGLNLIPAVMFFCGLLNVFQELGAFEAASIVFNPILKPLMGIPGTAGVAFISSFTGSDVAAVMTKELVDNGEMTDEERTIFTSYQYAGSAVINNTITGGAPLLAISPIALGPIIVIQFVCKVIGANIVRIVLKVSGKKHKEGK
ncbi:membrane protein [Oscillospiraceae bacterium]|nr:membrane protein [Oscillospiraceae bacterium]